MKAYMIGDLVHIPQAVKLIDRCPLGSSESQLEIPRRILETVAPKLGVVTHIEKPGYVRVYCEGTHWSVHNTSIYRIGGDA